jgi:hypothetical protein
MRQNRGFVLPVRCLVAIRPGDRFTIAGLAKILLKVGAASLLVRAVLALAGMLLLLVLVAVAYVSS